MDIAEIANGLFVKAKKLARDNTIDYVPDLDSLERNKTKALFGAAALGGAYLIPGEHPVIVATALGYAALKCYHSIRDWSGK